MTKECIKDILNQIIRAKRTNPEGCVLFVNQNVYDSLDKAGLVIHWEENHPGVIWLHCNICGLPVIIDKEVELFTVMPQQEARERINKMMFQIADTQ